MKDLTDIILAYLDGDLDDRQQAKLATRLKTDPKAGELFVRLSRMHAHLPEVASLETSVGGETAQDNRPVLRRLGWQAAAAAVLLGAVTLGLFQLARSPVRSLATVENLVSAEWSGPALKIGQALPEGRLHLKSGYVRVRFSSGAAVILEGPAEFELIDGNRGILHRGQLVADVPTEAIGFQIETPKTRVIDLGTEFAVSVESSGSTEVHVLQGKVRTESPTGKDRGELLEQNQARRFATGETAETIKAEPSRFVRSLPQPATEDVGYVHWSFDRLEGHRVLDLGRGMGAGPYDARLAHLEKGGDRPRLVSGPFGKAISLNGEGQHLETDFAGIGGSEARTIAFWVRVPVDAPERNAVSMVSWGSFQDGGAAWQISWNWIKKDGPIGHLRTGMYHGQIIGTTDLRDGRWHHIAVVMYAGKGEGEPVRSKALPGLVLDDSVARKVGDWKRSTYSKGYVDAGYIHDSGKQRGRKSVVFSPKIKQTAHRAAVRFARDVPLRGRPGGARDGFEPGCRRRRDRGRVAVAAGQARFGSGPRQGPGCRTADSRGPQVARRLGGGHVDPRVVLHRRPFAPDHAQVRADPNRHHLPNRAAREARAQHGLPKEPGR